MTEYQIVKIDGKEVLCRWEMIKEEKYSNFATYKAVPIITKEAFLECYNEWVLKPMRENPISIQHEFGVPVDNGGVTPV